MATVHTGTDALAALAERGWDALLAESAHPDPTRRAAWMTAWRERLSPEGEAVAITVERDGELVAGAPLVVTNGGSLSRVRLLGADGPWFNLEPLARDSAARRALFAAMRDLPGDVLILEGIERDGASAKCARGVLPRGPVVATPDGFRLAIADPPKSMRKRRKEVRRGLRRAEDAGRPLATEAYRGQEVLPRLDDLLDFHAAHFDRGGVNGLAGDEARPFTRHALGELSTDALRLIEVRDRDRDLVAFDITIVNGTYAAAYTGALDRASGLPNLGWISVMALIESLEQEGIQIVDFGASSDAYKGLIAREVPLCRVYAPISARGRLALFALRLRGLLWRGEG
ncbi:MAG: GNAT family N-acetyltransferase [Thermoleophilia bacterium]|nr:GNAT family N-acetyltransferase [Thermoleophilia bacterium]